MTELVFTILGEFDPNGMDGDTPEQTAYLGGVDFDEDYKFNVLEDLQMVAVSLAANPNGKREPRDKLYRVRVIVEEIS